MHKHDRKVVELKTRRCQKKRDIQEEMGFSDRKLLK